MPEDPIKNPNLFDAIKKNRIETSTDSVDINLSDTPNMFDKLPKLISKENSNHAISPDITFAGSIIPDSKYLRDNIPFASITHAQELLPYRQPSSAKIANGLIGALGGGLMTAAENAGYMLDLPGRLARLAGADLAADNAFSEAMRKAKQDFYNDVVPIYRTNPGKVFDFSDRGWWWETLRSVGESAVGFALPGMAATKAFGALAKGMNLGKQLAGIVSKFGAAVQTNFAEGMSMAVQSFDQNMQLIEGDFMQKTVDQLASMNPDMSREDIYKLATNQLEQYKKTPEYMEKRDAVANQADRIVLYNRAMILSDYAELGGIMKGTGLLAKKVEAKTFGSFMKEVGKTAPIEGLEEWMQGIFQQEQEYQGLKAAGMDISKYESDPFQRMTKMAFSDQNLLETAMGFFTGPVQFAAMQAHPYFTSAAETNKYVKEQETFNEKVKDYLRGNLANVAASDLATRQAADNNDDISGKLVHQDSFARMAYAAFEKDGGTGLSAILDEIESGNDAIEGIDVKEQREMVKGLKKQMKSLGKIYQGILASEKVGNADQEKINELMRKDKFITTVKRSILNDGLIETNKRYKEASSALKARISEVAASMGKSIDSRQLDLSDKQDEIESLQAHLEHLNNMRSDLQERIDEQTTAKKELDTIKRSLFNKGVREDLKRNPDGSVVSVPSVTPIESTFESTETPYDQFNRVNRSNEGRNYAGQNELDYITGEIEKSTLSTIAKKNVRRFARKMVRDGASVNEVIDAINQKNNTQIANVDEQVVAQRGFEKTSKKTESTFEQMQTKVESPFSESTYSAIVPEASKLTAEKAATTSQKQRTTRSDQVEEPQSVEYLIGNVDDLMAFAIKKLQSDRPMSSKEIGFIYEQLNRVYSTPHVQGNEKLQAGILRLLDLAEAKEDEAIAIEKENDNVIPGHVDMLAEMTQQNFTRNSLIKQGKAYDEYIGTINTSISNTQKEIDKLSKEMEDIASDQDALSRKDFESLKTEHEATADVRKYNTMRQNYLSALKIADDRIKQLNDPAYQQTQFELQKKLNEAFKKAADEVKADEDKKAKREAAEKENDDRYEKLKGKVFTITYKDGKGNDVNVEVTINPLDHSILLTKESVLSNISTDKNIKRVNESFYVKDYSDQLTEANEVKGGSLTEDQLVEYTRLKGINIDPASKTDNSPDSDNPSVDQADGVDSWVEESKPDFDFMKTTGWDVEDRFRQSIPEIVEEMESKFGIKITDEQAREIQDSLQRWYTVIENLWIGADSPYQFMIVTSKNASDDIKNRVVFIEREGTSENGDVKAFLIEKATGAPVMMGGNYVYTSLPLATYISPVLTDMGKSNSKFTFKSGGVDQLTQGIYQSDEALIEAIKDPDVKKAAKEHLAEYKKFRKTVYDSNKPILATISRKSNGVENTDSSGVIRSIKDVLMDNNDSTSLHDLEIRVVTDKSGRGQVFDINAKSGSIYVKYKQQIYRLDSRLLNKSEIVNLIRVLQLYADRYNRTSDNAKANLIKVGDTNYSLFEYINNIISFGKNSYESTEKYGIMFDKGKIVFGPDKRTVDIRDFLEHRIEYDSVNDRIVVSDTNDDMEALIEFMQTKRHQVNAKTLRKASDSTQHTIPLLQIDQEMKDGKVVNTVNPKVERVNYKTYLLSKGSDGLPILGTRNRRNASSGSIRSGNSKSLNTKISYETMQQAQQERAKSRLYLTLTSSLKAINTVVPKTVQEAQPATQEDNGAANKDAYYKFDPNGNTSLFVTVAGSAQPTSKKIQLTVKVTKSVDGKFGLEYIASDNLTEDQITSLKATLASSASNSMDKGLFKEKAQPLDDSGLLFYPKEMMAEEIADMFLGNGVVDSVMIEVISNAIAGEQAEINGVDTGSELKEDNDDPGDLPTFSLVASLPADQNSTITEEEVKWFDETFPDIPVEVREGLINGKDFGQFVNGAKVLISSAAIAGVYYHEGYHVVSLKTTTQEERTAMYDAYRDLVSNKKLTDKEAEEGLAELFREYMLAGGAYKIKKRAIGNIFKRIWNLLRSIFGVSPDQKISKRFKEIATNKFNKDVRNTVSYDPSMTAIKQDAEFFRAMDSSVNAYFFNALFGTAVHAFDDLVSMEGREYAEKYEDIIYNVYGVAKESMVKFIIYRRNQLVNLAKTMDPKTNAYRNIVAESNKLTDLKDELKKPGSELWANLVERHKKTLSRFGVKPTFTDSIDPDDDAMFAKDSPQLLSTLEFSQKDKASGIVKLLIAGLADQELVDGMSQVKLNGYGLATSVDYQGTFNFIHNQLAGIQNFDEQVDKLQKLTRTMPVLTLLLKRLGVIDGKTISDGLGFNKVLIQNQFADQFNKTKMTPYLTLIAQNDDGSTEIKTIDSLATNAIRHIVSKWESNGRWMASHGSELLSINAAGDIVVDVNKVVKLSNGKKESLKSVIRSDIQTKLEMLANLGIDIAERNFYDNLSEDTQEDVKEQVNKIINAVHSTGSLKVLYNRSEEDVVGRITKIAELADENDVHSAELQYINPEGKTIYGLALNSFLSIMSNDYNKGRILPIIDNDIFTKNSLWKKELTKSGNISFVYLGGTRVESEGETGVTIVKTTEGDRLMIQVNAVLDGIMPFLRAADNKIERGIEINGFGSIHDEATFIRILWGYLEDEFNSSITYINKKQSEGIKNYDENIKEFRFFKDKLRDKNGNKIDLSKFKGQTFAKFVEVIGQDHINDSLGIYSKKLVSDTVKLLMKYNIFGAGGENIGISTSHLKNIFGTTYQKYSKDQIATVAARYAYNYVSGNVEQTKLFVGDLAYYKQKGADKMDTYDTRDFFKRMRGVVSTKKTARYGEGINTWMQNHMPRGDGKVYTDDFTSIVFDDPYYASDLKDDQGKIIYEGKEEADGQGFISIHAYRELMFKLGAWRGNQEDYYRWLMDKRKFEKDNPGEVFTKPKPNAMFPPLKPQYFGPRVDVDSQFVPTFFKFSVMPVWEELFDPKAQIVKLARQMEENKVDMALMESANKVGAKTINGKLPPFYNDNGTIADLDTRFNVKIGLKYFGTQLDIAPEFHNHVIFGTQFRTLMGSNLFEDGAVISGKEHIATMLTEMNDLIKSIIRTDMQELIDQMGIHVNTDLAGNKTYAFKDNNREFIRSMVEDEMISRGFSDNEIEGWNEMMSNDKSFVDFMSSRERVENLLFAITRNRVIQQKMPGDMLILGASTGFETTHRVKKQGQNAWSSNMDALKFYQNEDTGTIRMEVYMPNFYKEFASAGSTLSVKDGSIVDKEGNVLSTDKRLIQVVGFRIPTSGLNSIESITIKGFLPREAGSTIIVPSDLVDKAGSDYDIDKMTIFTPSYFVGKDGKINYIKYGTAKEMQAQYVEYRNASIARELARIKSAFYKMSRNLPDGVYEGFEEPLKKALIAVANAVSYSQPVEEATQALLKLESQVVTDDISRLKFNHIKEMISRLSSVADNEESYMVTRSMFDKMAKQNRIVELTGDILLNKISRKSLETPISTDAFNKVATEVAELKGSEKVSYTLFSPSHIMDETTKFWTGAGGIGIAALNNTSHVKSQMAGLYIAPSNAGAFIFEDVNRNPDGGISLAKEKDASGNDITETFNQFINAVVDIVKNPVLSNINLNNATMNTYALLFRAGVPLTSSAYFVSNPIIVEYIENLNTMTSKFYAASSKGQRLSKGDIYRMMVGQLGFAEKEKAEAVRATTFSESKLMEALVYEASNEEKFVILRAFYELSNIAQDLTAVIQATNQDTNANANRADFYARKDNIAYVLKQKPNSFGNMTTIENVDNMYKNTFLDAFREIEETSKEMLNNMFFVESNPSAKSMLNSIRDKILKANGTGTAKERAIGKLETALINAIIQTHADENNTILGKRADDLLYGDNSVAARLLSDNSSTAMALKKELAPVLEGAMNTKTERAFSAYIKMINRRLESYDVDELVSVFKELKSVNPELFADIIDSLLLTEGVGNSPTTYKSIVPALDFNHRILSILNELQDIKFDRSSFERAFAKHNWKDPVIMPTLKNVEPHGAKTFRVPATEIYKTPFGLGKARVQVTMENGSKKSMVVILQPMSDEYGEGYMTEKINGITYIILRRTNRLGQIGRINYYDAINNIDRTVDNKMDEVMSNSDLLRITGNFDFDMDSVPEAKAQESTVKHGRGQMKYVYGSDSRQEVKSKTLIEAIRNGERTATTRYTSDKNIDYWKQFNVGDIIEFYSDNDSVSVVITKSLTKLTENTSGEEWSKKEGWSVDYFNRNVKPRISAGAYQLEFRVANQNRSLSYTNHSGGALGADTAWDTIGKEFGMTNNKHYWADTKTPHGNTEISKADYEEGKVEAAKAATRNFGYQYQTMKDSRLIRNWAQVKYADAIFAIGHIVSAGEKLFPNIPNDNRLAKTQAVQGGTGYAVAMAILHNKPVFVFEQNKNQWFTWSNGKFEQTDTPTLTKNFAGIGTRNINEKGLQAIRDVYNKTFNTSSTTIVNGINISSYEKGLGHELSNFATLPGKLQFRGKEYTSSEAAYQANKGSNLSDQAVKQLMVDVLVAKLTQFPSINQQIKNAGGMAFLEQSSHNLIKDGKTIKSDRWTGKNGLFMNSLREAYSIVNGNTNLNPDTTENTSPTPWCLF